MRSGNIQNRKIRSPPTSAPGKCPPLPVSEPILWSCSGRQSKRKFLSFSRRMVMKIRVKNHIYVLAISLLFGAVFAYSGAVAADKLVVLYSARVMSQSMPWIAQEAGLFRKYDLDLQLVYVGGGPPAAAAALAGDTEVTLVGASSIVRPFVQGSRDLVFIGGIKNILIHSI